MTGGREPKGIGEAATQASDRGIADAPTEASQRPVALGPTAAASRAAAPPFDIASSDTLGPSGSASASLRALEVIPTPDQLVEVSRETYQRLGEVARGGLGRIIRAVDQRTQRIVAIKEMLADNDDTAIRFVREALVTANLQHPAIVPVYEVAKWPDGKPFYAMKLVNGKPLDRAIAAAKTLDARLALLPHVETVADALAYAHGEHVIHRDLKPHNVLCGDHGETVVIDWGLARRIDDTDTAPTKSPHSAQPGETYVGAVMGTLSYMAPEQARAETVDERADVFAIGAILYHLLAGRPPHIGTELEEMLQRVRDAAAPPLATLAPNAPRDLVAIVDRAIDRDPAKRYPSAAELALDLRRFRDGQLVLAHHYTRGERIRRFARKNLTLIALAVVAVATIATVTVLSFGNVVDARDDAKASEGRAVQAGSELRRRLVASSVDRSAAELVAGRPDRALAQVIAAATENGGLDPAMRTLAGRALEQLPHIDRRLGAVVSVAFPPTGTDLIIATEREVIRWDPKSDTVRWRAEGTGGDAIVMGDVVATPLKQRVALFSLADGKLVTTLSAQPGKFGMIGADPGRRWLATVNEKTIEVFDVTTRERVAEIAIAGVRRSPVISPDGQRLAIYAAADGRWKIVDRAGKVTELCKCAEVVPAGDEVAFSQRLQREGVANTGETRLVIADWSGKVRLDVATGTSPLVSMAVAGSSIAMIADDGTVQLRDLATGALVWRTASGLGDGGSLVMAGSYIHVLGRGSGTITFDAASGLAIARSHVTGDGLVVSSNGMRLATATLNERVSVWDLNLERVQAISPTPARVNLMAFDGDAILSASADGGLHETRAGKTTQLAAGKDPITSLHRLADGNLAVATLDDRIVIRDRTGRALREFKGGASAEPSPNGATIAGALADGTLALWSVATGERIREVDKLGGRATGIRWSPDGEKLAAIRGDGGTGVWKSDGTALREIKPGGFGAGAVFTKDGRTLALAAKPADRLLAIGGGDDRVLANMPAGAVALVAEIHDDRLLLAGTGFVGVWNLETAALVMSVSTSSLVTAATFVSDDLIAGGGADRMVHLWDAHTGIEMTSIPTSAGVFRVFPDRAGYRLGITTGRGALVWKLPRFDGDLAQLRSLAECRLEVEVHDGHVRSRKDKLDPERCNRAP